MQRMLWPLIGKATIGAADKLTHRDLDHLTRRITIKRLRIVVRQVHTYIRGHFWGRFFGRFYCHRDIFLRMALLTVVIGHRDQLRNLNTVDMTLNTAIPQMLMSINNLAALFFSRVASERG